MESLEHYFEDGTIVGQAIEKYVAQYRKRRRGIPPDEFKEILHQVANYAIQYH
jgi:hypothetical protein